MVRAMAGNGVVSSMAFSSTSKSDKELTSSTLEAVKEAALLLWVEVAVSCAWSRLNRATKPPRTNKLVKILLTGFMDLLSCGT